MLEWIDFEELDLDLADLQDDFCAAVPLTDGSGTLMVDWADARDSPTMVCVDTDWEEKLNWGLTEAWTTQRVVMSTEDTQKLIAYLEAI